MISPGRDALGGYATIVDRRERATLFGAYEFLSRFGIESLEQLPPLPEAEEPENEGEHEELIP